MKPNESKTAKEHPVSVDRNREEQSIDTLTVVIALRLGVASRLVVSLRKDKQSCVSTYGTKKQ